LSSGANTITVKAVEKKSSVLVLAVVLLSGVAAAEVPELSVSPSNVTESLPANQVQELEFEFVNENPDKKIYNVSLEDQPYLNWSENRFHINESQSKRVEAEFYTETPSRVNDSFSVPYYYNQTEGNNTGITFDKNFYPELSFQLSTFYEETNVSLDVFKQNFTLELGESESSVFEVRNDGNETGFNVSYGAEDVRFDPGTEFNLSRDDSRLVKFNVSIPKPSENPTNATNRTYTRTVRVSGENFETRSFSVSVFVPFREYDEVERQEDIVEYLQEIQSFCAREENQGLPICGGEVVRYQNRTEFINNTPVYQANFTEAERDALIQYANASTEKYSDIIERIRLQQNTIRTEQEDTRSAIGSNLTQVANATQRNTEAIERLAGEIEQELQEDQRRQEERRTRNTILLIFFILLGMAVGGVKMVKIWMEASRDRRM